MAELVYIIPPYLLNTCIGSELQSELHHLNKELGTLNVVSTDSALYQSKTTPVRKSPFVFSNDAVLNSIVKSKIRYKLAILGILGNSPMELIDDTHLFELYNIFKNRLVNDRDDHDDEDKSSSDDITVTKGSEESNSHIVYGSKVGEVTFLAPEVPKSYSKFLELPLKDLLRLIKTQERSHSSIPPSFVKLESGKVFQYPLPIAWTSFFENKYFKYFQEKLNLDLNNDSSYANINMSVSKREAVSPRNSGAPDGEILYDHPEIDLHAKYFNFIGDKAIASHTGVFYYEVEVEQEVTESTSFKPLLVMNDSFISADRSLNLSIGFLKKIINSQSSKIDVETVKNEISDDTLNEDLNLSVKPGEFKGSFAISYEDSSFCNSLTSLNRRFSSRHGLDSLAGGTGRTDLGIPFKTKVIKDNPTHKIYKTDPIGCGINFIDKSIFITLNGVLVKVIKQEELAGSSISTDSLFTSGSDTSVYPMLGFKVNETAVESIDKAHNLQTKLNVKTNFGFREFHFNINKYVKNFKSENEKKILNLASQSVTSPNYNKTLNKLIKDYLNHEGYLDTFNSFNADLQNLSKEVEADYDQTQNSQDMESDKSTMKASHAQDRNIIKQYLFKNQYDLLFKFLKISYPGVLALHEFDLRQLKFVYLLKQYISEHNEEDHTVALNYRVELKENYESSMSANEIAKIDQLAGLLFVKDNSGLQNLPRSSLELDNYTKSVQKISSAINSAILKGLGFKKKSNLQQIFEGVDTNMKTLGLKAKDEKFMLVTFEKDHMDL